MIPGRRTTDWANHLALRLRGTRYSIFRIEQPRPQIYAAFCSRCVAFFLITLTFTTAEGVCCVALAAVYIIVPTCQDDVGG